MCARRRAFFMQRIKYTINKKYSCEKKLHKKRLCSIRDNNTIIQQIKFFFRKLGLEL